MSLYKPICFIILNSSYLDYQLIWSICPASSLLLSATPPRCPSSSDHCRSIVSSSGCSLLSCVCVADATVTAASPTLHRPNRSHRTDPRRSIRLIQGSVVTCRLHLFPRLPSTATAEQVAAAVMASSGAAQPSGAAGPGSMPPLSGGSSSSGSSGAPLSGPGSSASASASAGTASAFSAASVSDDSSMGAFLLAGLTQLYKHSSRKHEALRQQCVEVISKIKADEKARADKIAQNPKGSHIHTRSTVVESRTGPAVQTRTRRQTSVRV